MYNALVTIQVLTRIGWVEVVARCALGLTRILARIEHVPMVEPGEVDPDMLSVPAVLSTNHELLSEEDELYQVAFISGIHLQGSVSPSYSAGDHLVPPKNRRVGVGVGGSPATARSHHRPRLAMQRAFPATERGGDRWSSFFVLQLSPLRTCSCAEPHILQSYVCFLYRI